MTGHVFHPGHAELHGVTVIVSGRSGETWVGRYHEQTDRGVMMHDVAVHDPAAAPDLAAWIARLHKFGVRVDHRQFVVPAADVAEIRRFADVAT